MTRYLTTAFVGEGSTDRLFMPPVLVRSLNEMCAQEFRDTVDVADVVNLSSRSGPHTVEEIVALAEENAGYFTVVFVHRDQDGRHDGRVNRNWLHPLRAQWSSRAGALVAIVPVRMTEAWMLADADAIRDVLGVTWPDARFGVPARPADVERIQDPKAQVGRILGHGPVVNGRLVRLGALIRVGCLREVPAYRRWWDETTRVLEHAGYRRA